eukprot:COSAG06_NODE_2778_length_6298_cov_7.107437_2_plen_67_part_00
MQDQDEVRGSGKRECYISGTPSQINEAKRLIFELLDQFESNRHGVQRVTTPFKNPNRNPLHYLQPS